VDFGLIGRAYAWNIECKFHVESPETRNKSGVKNMLAKTVLRTGALGCALASAIALSACGTTPGERAVSGGLLGAGTGAAVGSVQERAVRARSLAALAAQLLARCRHRRATAMPMSRAAFATPPIPAAAWNGIDGKA
jgi:hypothetical protein